MGEEPRRPIAGHYYQNKMGVVVKVAAVKRGGNWQAQIIEHPKLARGHLQYVGHWTPNFWTEVPEPKEETTP